MLVILVQWLDTLGYIHSCPRSPLHCGPGGDTQGLRVWFRGTPLQTLFLVPFTLPYRHNTRSLLQVPDLIPFGSPVHRPHLRSPLPHVSFQFLFLFSMTYN